MAFDTEMLARENIRRLGPYSSARDEFFGTAEVYLDANENPFGSPVGGINRYPDPRQRVLKQMLANLKGVRVDQVFIGNGSDEAIDLLFRIFCEPGRDTCVICPPTYGMYRVAADVNNVGVTEIPLTADFQLDVNEILAAAKTAKLIFICSPNNPTGNLIRRSDILRIAARSKGIVVVDEAYIDFSPEPSFVAEIAFNHNLVVLQTFSKAWGLAGARVGMAFGTAEMTGLFDRTKPPYNVSSLSQQAVIEALSGSKRIYGWIESIVRERSALRASLMDLRIVETVYPSDANFLLVKLRNALLVYQSLIAGGIVVRDRSNVLLCEGCLRITVGTPAENEQLIDALRKIESELI